MHSLSRAVDIDARLSRLEERSRHVQIDDESLCDSCDARLGTKLFAMYPDDTVVCYKVSAQSLLLIVLLGYSQICIFQNFMMCIPEEQHKFYDLAGNNARDNVFFVFCHVISMIF